MLHLKQLFCISIAICVVSMTVLAQEPLRIIAFGAHPDDCEINVTGCAIKWAKMGHKVKLVSVTNGDIGHSVTAGGPLMQRRISEVEEIAKSYGFEAQVLDHHDGELMPTLEIRKELIRIIREWNADLVLVNRPNDYHPDHRYTSILVQDAAFMVTVPFICPDVPHLTKNPVFMYWGDRFQKPNPFAPNIVIPVDDVMTDKFKALGMLVSQFYEYGAGGNGDPASFFKGTWEEQLAFLKSRFDNRFKMRAAWMPVLQEFVSADKAKNVEYVEAFEICEYGSQPSKDELKRLFPFF